MLPMLTIMQSPKFPGIFFQTPLLWKTGKLRDNELTDEVCLSVLSFAHQRTGEQICQARQQLHHAFKAESDGVFKSKSAIIKKNHLQKQGTGSEQNYLL